MAKNLRCPKCDRTFGLPGHLARHLSATHGVKSRRAKKKKSGRGPGRPPGSKNKRVAAAGRGRPSAMVSRLGLRDMSIDQLADVIDAARDEARRKLATLQEMF